MAGTINRVAEFSAAASINCLVTAHVSICELSDLHFGQAVIRNWSMQWAGVFPFLEVCVFWQ